MCAVGGIRVWRNFSLGPRDAVAKMGEAMRHRGPDGQGHFVSEEFGCVHRLLRIYDPETPAGPYRSRDGRWILSFNGEIHNHEELREKLDPDGTFPWRYRSDAEILLEGWARSGPEFLSGINGMFAFSLWDQTESCLYLGRDRVGEKPLYFHSAPDFFAFASEIRGLLALGIPRRLDADVLGDYLRYRYVSGSRTFFAGVEKIRPASVLKIDSRGERNELVYWRPEGNSKFSGDAEELSVLFEDANRLRRPRAGLAAGVFLSGGIDSGAVASFLPRGSEAFTFEADGTTSEARAAGEIAARFGLHPNRVGREGSDLEVLDRALEATEEPLGDSILIPTWRLASSAREKGLRVVFSGEGADEIFGGYVHHWVFQSVVNIQAVVGNRGLGWMEAGLRRAPGIAKIFAAAHPTAVGSEAAIRMAGLLRARREGGGIGPHLSALFENPDAILAVGDRGSSFRRDRENVARSLRELMALDLETWFPSYALLRMDKILMRFGIEGRMPFTDHRLIEFAWGLEPRRLVDGWTRKKILRESLRDRLGAEIAGRPKLPFVWSARKGSPELQTAFREAPRRLAERGILRADRVKDLEPVEGDDLQAKRLFSLVALDRFLEKSRLSL